MHVTWWMPSSFTAHAFCRDVALAIAASAMEVRRGSPRRRAGRLHGGDPGRPARCERGLHRGGPGARRHLPAGRLHPDEGVGADRALPAPGARLVREARRVGRASPSSTSPAANEWKAAVVSQMTGGVASLFKANGVEWVQGQGLVPRREHDRGRGRRGRRVHLGDRRDGLVPDPAADPGPRLGALRRLDRPARADGGAGAGSRSSAAGSSAASSPRSSGRSGAR